MCDRNGIVLLTCIDASSASLFGKFFLLIVSSSYIERRTPSIFMHARHMSAQLISQLIIILNILTRVQ